jgi:hypothetical protein
MPPGPLSLILLFLFANAFVLGGIEEVGWRGFLQPRLQERTSVLPAGLAIGMVWWAWHLPLFLGYRNFVLEPVPFRTYTTFVIGASVVFAAFVNLAEGSVLPLMVMHVMANVSAFIEGSGGTLDGSARLALVVGSGSWWLLVVALVILFGRSMMPESKSISGPNTCPESRLLTRLALCQWWRGRSIRTLVLPSILSRETIESRLQTPSPARMAFLPVSEQIGWIRARFRALIQDS